MLDARPLRIAAGGRQIGLAGRKPDGKVDKADCLTVAEQPGADVGIEKAHLDRLPTILPKLLGES